MGMSEIFSKDQANFDGIIDNSGTSSYYKNIYVSEVRHRARIEISEQGTKAVDETNGKYRILDCMTLNLKKNHSILLFLVF